MTQDEIAQAMQDSAGNSWGNEAHFQRFAAIIVNAEREACANICEKLELPDWPNKVRQPLAQAIRARGQA